MLHSKKSQSRRNKKRQNIRHLQITSILYQKIETKLLEYIRQEKALGKEQHLVKALEKCQEKALDDRTSIEKLNTDT
jgi:hypothetical protein